MYDAIIVLGGSFIDESTLPEWVEKRLNAAIEREKECELIIVASRGSPHKPPIIGMDEHPIDECDIMAKYLLQNGVSPQKILKESWSLDTIGNAYGLLTLHCIPRNLRRLLIITSDFHMPRSQSIFKKVFSLFPLKIFEMVFYETKSTLPISEKERKSIMQWKKTSEKIASLKDLHQFLFEQHNAYNIADREKKNYSESDLKMYCS